MTTARAVLEVGEDVVTLSAAGSAFEFALDAEAVLRPLVDGRTADRRTCTLSSAARTRVLAVALDSLGGEPLGELRGARDGWGPPSRPPRILRTW
ncbi:hypothetical protein P1P75_38265 [Streptomyces sp. ID05-39B]|uniref:hypothetical protein n=1 Tax=Streptomyces sp. ID05-39B TaxID=3028664 RepID=UPI0029A19FE8|nr:hypothetical protein [Streptomyces sp. ID05-39B]MDX3532088.1 hypothetical protein [Streptomyces sp. ID05-39B]